MLEYTLFFSFIPALLSSIKSFLYLSKNLVLITSHSWYDSILFWVHCLAAYPCSLHSQVTIELPYVLVQTLIYGLIVYAMIGFEWTGSKFFWYLFIMYCTLLYFTFYGMSSVAMTPNHNIAAIISVAFYCIWNLFSGFLIPRPVTTNSLQPMYVGFS